MDNKDTADHMLRIFIVGTTAVGKTKLSVELAHKFKGEIISSDSKQLYKHASIMTAKVTEQQAQGIPHYMVDCLDLHQNAFNRNKFFREATKALSSIEARKKIPIVVGGTNYYTETILYNLKNLTMKASSQSGQSQDEQSEDENKLTKEKQLTQEQKIQIQSMKKMTVQQKYELLMKHDKLIALKTHRNDQNRITQFLERILADGKQISSNYEKFTAELRNPHSIIFWVRNSDKEELLSMVTKRIHKMLDKAGLTQIFAIYYYIETHNKIKNKQTEVKEIEEYSGAASSIGVRQFKELYLEVREQIHQIFKEHQKQIYINEQPNYQFIHQRLFSRFDTLKYSEQTLVRCRDQLILDTKHYCKRQITWIKNRFFVDHPENRKHFFVLELSQNEKDQKMAVLQRFDRQVAKKAIQIVDKIQADGFGSIQQDEKEFVNAAKTESIEEWKKYYCEPCKLEVNGSYDWNCHIGSKKHQKQAKYYEKKQQREKYIEQQKQKAKSKGKAVAKSKQKNKEQQ